MFVPSCWLSYSEEILARKSKISSRTTYFEVWHKRQGKKKKPHVWVMMPLFCFLWALQQHSVVKIFLRTEGINKTEDDVISEPIKPSRRWAEHLLRGTVKSLICCCTFGIQTCNLSLMESYCQPLHCLFIVFYFQEALEIYFPGVTMVTPDTDTRESWKAGSTTQRTDQCKTFFFLFLFSTVHLTFWWWQMSKKHSYKSIQKRSLITIGTLPIAFGCQRPLKTKFPSILCCPAELCCHCWRIIKNSWQFAPVGERTMSRLWQIVKDKT